MSFSDQLAIAGLVVGIALAILGMFSPAIWDRWRKRHQVREIWASIDEVWKPKDPDLHSKILVGGRLVVRNPTPWLVRDVIVMAPQQLAAQSFEVVAPRSKVEIQLPPQTTNEVSGTPITLQVTDGYGRIWQWTPSLDLLEPIPPRISHLAKLVQWSSRWWPSSWHRRLNQMPLGVQRFLWGYPPVGEPVEEPVEEP